MTWSRKGKRSMKSTKEKNMKEKFNEQEQSRMKKWRILDKEEKGDEEGDFEEEIDEHEDTEED